MFKPCLVTLLVLGLVFLDDCPNVGGRAIGKPWDVDTDWSYKTSSTDEPSASQLNPKGTFVTQFYFRVRDVANFVKHSLYTWQNIMWQHLLYLGYPLSRNLLKFEMDF